jgi:hypothetical protein
MAARLRVEFHCHTIHSEDSLTKVETLLAACRKKGIDRVVITDHNTIAGAREAQALDPEQVIVGEEIMTQEGELLTAFVKEEIPEGLPALEAIARLREQDAFISVSHPFDRLRWGSWAQQDLERIAPLVDAIEIFNARCLSPRANVQAKEFAQVHSLLGTVGSDAHAAFELGTATATMPYFEDAAGLRAALAQAEYRVALSRPWVRLASRYAVLRKKLG